MIIVETSTGSKTVILDTDLTEERSPARKNVQFLAFFTFVGPLRRGGCCALSTPLNDSVRLWTTCLLLFLWPNYDPVSLVPDYETNAD